MSQLPPATTEGWYALHQVFGVDWAAWHGADAAARGDAAEAARRLLGELAAPGEPGWSAAFQLIGGGADVMLVHFRETLEALGRAELAVRRSGVGGLLRLEYDFTSVTEAGLYNATVQAVEAAEPRSKEYERLVEEIVAAERPTRFIRSRLFPEIPEGMRYVSFYPMTKRRAYGQNWYELTVEERNRLMREHGLSGRRYAGRIFQVITGAVGFEDWEWGVTLFAKDPLEFKRIVTEMRYDEASARYGEFGDFFVGVRLEEEGFAALLAPAS